MTLHRRHMTGRRLTQISGLGVALIVAACTVPGIDAMRAEISHHFRGCIPEVLQTELEEKGGASFLLRLDRSGTVKEAHWLDEQPAEADPELWALAEQAREVFLSGPCNQLELPVRGYETWKAIVVDINAVNGLL